MGGTRDLWDIVFDHGLPEHVGVVSVDPPKVQKNFALGCRIIPAKVTAAGFGVYAGIANTIGSAAPFIIGLLVSYTGDFTAGLQFLVACCVITSLAMIPLMRKY